MLGGRIFHTSLACWCFLIAASHLEPLLRHHQIGVVQDFFCWFNHLCELFLVPHIASVGASGCRCVVVPFHNGNSSQKFASAADWWSFFSSFLVKSTSFVYVEGFTIWPLEAGGATIATAAVVLMRRRTVTTTRLYHSWYLLVDHCWMTGSANTLQFRSLTCGCQ